MGLRGWLMRAASVRVLVVSVPYGTRARLRVEAEIVRRGWLVALTPAEASLLVVCGTPGEELAAAIDVVWADLVAPRAMVRLEADSDVAAELDRAVQELRDEPAQLLDAASRVPWTPDAEDMPMDHHMDMPMDMDMGDHAHHMGNPGGLKMADRAEDRDGLKLDQLHVPLGPILPDWPDGLVVDTVMQGDVIQHATVRTLGGHGDPFWNEPWLAPGTWTRGAAERRRAAAHLDSLTRLLNVAGWPDAAAEAARLRDRTLAGAGKDELAGRHARFARRVSRSRILRWMLPEGVRDRMERWLDGTATAIELLDETTPLEGDDRPRDARALAVLPELLEGAELATARLIVASLDPDLEQVADA